MLQNITEGALQCELGDWLPLMPVESSYSTSKDKSLSVALAFVNCDKLDVVRIMRPVKFLPSTWYGSSKSEGHLYPRT